MGLDIPAASGTPNGSRSLKGDHPKGLLDALTAFRWDLKHILLKRDGCPEAMTNNIQRLLDEIDAAIEKLGDLAREHGRR